MRVSEDEERNEELPRQVINNLYNKFQKMSVLQLKKEKLRMVKDLQQINGLLDELIQEQTQGGTKFIDLQKQLIRTKRLERGMIKSLENFEFMLTGDYSVRVDQEICKMRAQVKIKKEQVNKFNRMLSVPMQKDIEICDNLERQVYQIQKQIEDMKVKNNKKKQQIVNSNKQIEQKAQNLKQVLKQIQKIKDDAQIQGIHIENSSQQVTKHYQFLLKKRQKQILCIEKVTKKLSREYKQKMKKYEQIQQTSKQIQHFLQEIEKTVQQKTQELKLVKNRKSTITGKQRNSDSNIYNRKKIKTQETSELQLLNKQRQIHQQNLSRVKQKSCSTHFSKISYKTATQSNDQILPRLYKALGKQKFQIEEDCDIQDLLYV